MAVFEASERRFREEERLRWTLELKHLEIGKGNSAAESGQLASMRNRDDDFRKSPPLFWSSWMMGTL